MLCQVLEANQPKTAESSQMTSGLICLDFVADGNLKHIISNLLVITF